MLNKGYLTAKTDKASDEVYTPAYAVKPILKYCNVAAYPNSSRVEAFSIYQRL